MYGSRQSAEKEKTHTLMVSEDVRFCVRIRLWSIQRLHKLLNHLFPLILGQGVGLLNQRAALQRGVEGINRRFRIGVLVEETDRNLLPPFHRPVQCSVEIGGVMLF